VEDKIFTNGMQHRPFFPKAFGRDGIRGDEAIVHQRTSGVRYRTPLFLLIS